MAVVTVIKMAVEETGGSVSQRQGGQGAGVDADGGAIAAAVSAGGGGVRGWSPTAKGKGRRTDREGESKGDGGLANISDTRHSS